MYIYLSCEFNYFQLHEGYTTSNSLLKWFLAQTVNLKRRLVVANFRFEFKTLAFYLDHKVRARDPLQSADGVLYEHRTCNQNSEEISKNKTCYGKTRDGYSDYKHITHISEQQFYSLLSSTPALFVMASLFAERPIRTTIGANPRVVTKTTHAVYMQLSNTQS